MNSDQLLQKFKGSPIIQMLVIFIAGAVCMLISNDGADGDSKWRLFSMAVLLYVVLNTVLGIFHPKWTRYIVISVICFALMVTAFIYFGNAIAAKSFGEVRSAKFTFLVFLVFYLMLIGLSGVYRTVFYALGGEQKKDPD